MRPPPRPGPAIVAEFYRGDDHITGDGRSPTAEVICDYDNLTALPSRVAHDLLGDETQRAPGYNYVLIMLGAGLRHSNGHIATGDVPAELPRPGDLMAVCGMANPLSHAKLTPTGACR